MGASVVGVGGGMALSLHCLHHAISCTPPRGARGREESKMIGEIAKTATALIARHPYIPMGEGGT